MRVGRKPQHKCEAEACVDYAKLKVKVGDRVARLCERHATREKNDPGTVELEDA